MIFPLNYNCKSCSQIKNNYLLLSISNKETKTIDYITFFFPKYRMIWWVIAFLNCSQSAEMLMSESGCRLDHPAAGKFRQHVMDADWTKADHDLQELKPLLENSQSLLVSISFWTVFFVDFSLVIQFFFKDI